MDCPKCVGKLQKKNMEHIEIDACPVCEGIWFDAGELEGVIKADSKDFKFISVGREEFDGQEIADMEEELDKEMGSCPRCEDGTKLIKKEQVAGKHKINIDVCPKGHGVWLDGGEIQELRKRGLVNLKDQVDCYLAFLRYIFSKDGFEQFRRDITRKRRGSL